MSVRNRIRMHQQRESLSRIIDSAGVMLRAAQLSGDNESIFELHSVIGNATFMMSTLGFLLTSADRNELELDEVGEVIAQAETMADIMSSAFFH